MVDKTGLLIDYDNIIKPRKLSKLANRLSPVPEIENYHIGIVLVIPKSELILLEQVPKGISRVNYLNTNKFVDSISGYSYFIYDRRKKVCEIMGIQGSISKYVLDSVLSSIPNDVTLWVGIPIENQNILELVEHYTKVGFKNPYICKSSPLGYTFPSYGLCLLKDNNITESISSNEVTYVLEQFVQREEEICKIKLRFTPKTIEHLKHLSNIGSTLNTDTSISQKEIAGSFKVSDVSVNSVFELELNKEDMVSGEEEGVQIVDSLYNFHTHPIEAYNRNNVKLGWPSAQDYIGFMASVKVNKTIFHAVITVEGIYIISVGNHWINKVSELGSSCKRFISKNYKIKHKPDRDAKWYVNKINSLSYEGFPIFNIKFFTWENVLNVFEISFKNTEGNCFGREETLEKYEQLYLKIKS